MEHEWCDAMQAAASKATSKLAPIQAAVKSVAASGAAELGALPCAPPLTWNVLKAMLLVMGKTADHMDTWLKCRSAAFLNHYGQLSLHVLVLCIVSLSEACASRMHVQVLTLPVIKVKVIKTVSRCSSRC